MQTSALTTGAQIAGDDAAGRDVKKASIRRATAAGRDLMQKLLATPPPPGKRIKRAAPPTKRIKKAHLVVVPIHPNDKYCDQTCSPNMAFVHRQSCEGVKSELDLFDVPPTQTSIEEGCWTEYQLLTSLHSGGTIEFVLP